MEGGFDWQVVDLMLTNFHLPRSTLLMMVSAFAGRQRVLEAYEQAVREGYRFYSEESSEFAAASESAVAEAMDDEYR